MAAVLFPPSGRPRGHRRVMSACPRYASSQTAPPAPMHRFWDDALCLLDSVLGRHSLLIRVLRRQLPPAGQ